MATALDLVRQALQRLMVVAADGAMASVDATNGLEALNNIIDQLKSESLFVYGQERTTFTITTGVGTYVVGTGQTVNVNRPQYVDGVGFTDSSTNPAMELPLLPLTPQGYELIAFKSLTSNLPTSFFYNLDAPDTATLKLYPIPTSTTLTGALYSRFQVSEFANLNVTLNLPPGWRRMFITNLAMELAPVYEQEPSGALIQQARESMAAVQVSNIQNVVAGLDPGAVIGGDKGYGPTYAQFLSGQF